ncbi:hypothetical protein VPH46_15620 [Sphingomonas sp. MJ1 (PH-R8)]|uniref:hypothetical protein n=1 Tax=Sphingomonas sp. MJ1 (PH-R8) TaxID=3112950 RepID=UPI003A864D99
MLALLAILLAGASCGTATQSVSNDTVGAFEVPLAGAKDRAALLAVLRSAAQAEGAHIDAATDNDLRDIGAAMPQAKMSVHAAVWRGSDDKENWAVIMDQADHLGLIWIMFARGVDETRARRFRVRVMRAIKARWPNTLSLPIIDGKTIPLHRDLVKTPTGYRLDPSAASKYDRKPAG